jgi:hypothetical protein
MRAPKIDWYYKVGFSKLIYRPQLPHTRRWNDGGIMSINTAMLVIVVSLDTRGAPLLAVACGQRHLDYLKHTLFVGAQ